MASQLGPHAAASKSSKASISPKGQAEDAAIIGFSCHLRNSHLLQLWPAMSRGFLGREPGCEQGGPLKSLDSNRHILYYLNIPELLPTAGQVSHLSDKPRARRASRGFLGLSVNWATRGGVLEELTDSSWPMV